MLDEKAMRAAEIHEVLTGLEDFKARIIDGAFRAARTPFPCSPLRVRVTCADVERVGCRSSNSGTLSSVLSASSAREIDATKLAKKVRGK